MCASVVGALPGRLSSVVTPSLVGFCVINGFTFGVDLTLIALLHGGRGWPIWLAVSVSYLSAFGLSFALNRWLNFRSHAPIGPQIAWYFAAIVVNYSAIVLGVGAGLTTVGLHYQLSRVTAGACEAVFMYCVLRWVVFAQSPATRSDKQ
jgi:putative flippase GtrA